ncbi:MAG: hypothetical protein QME58_12500 [Bacteroidota bacterium]|nr:hypothetical protein [Bacteroidota bacterium]
MTPIQDYIKNSKFGRAWIYEKINRGELYSLNINNRTYIIEPDEAKTITLNADQRAVLVESIKSELDDLILAVARTLEGKAATIKFIQHKAERWQLLGVELRGYDHKSVYRKLKKISLHGHTALARKTRSDKFAVKNALLSKMFDKARALASYIYFKNANINLSLVVDLVQHFARNNEEYYELAAVPRSTLYRQLGLDFKQSGYPTLHQYFNHYNLFMKQLPTVIGAFTDDVGFMDYIVGDDHKADVASVFVWDDTKRDYVQKKVQIWFWAEARTMNPLGWIVKVGDFTAQDIINSLVPVVAQFGLPRKKFLVDNGICRGDDFKEFVKKLYLNTNDHALKFSKPYTPTDKATIERCFGFFKSELDGFFTNFVGPDKEKESRHTTQKLSPEECNIFLQDYQKSFENYIQGFYLTRPRTRVVKGKKEKVNILDYFNRNWTGYIKHDISMQTIRYAMSCEDIKVYNHRLIFRGEQYLPALSLPVSFNGHKFRVVYNPSEPSEVDLYAFEQMFDRATGEIYESGSYIATLCNTRMQADKHHQVNNNRKEINKHVKVIAEAKLAEMEMNSEEFSKALVPNIAPDGEIIRKRELIKKQLEADIKEKLTQLPVLVEQIQPALSSGETDTVKLTFEV